MKWVVTALLLVTVNVHAEPGLFGGIESLSIANWYKSKVDFGRQNTPAPWPKTRPEPRPQPKPQPEPKPVPTPQTTTAGQKGNIYFFKRSDRLFSPRFDSHHDRSPSLRVQTAIDFGTNAIVWHYPKFLSDGYSELISLAQANIPTQKINCALPAIVRTKEMACLNQSGQPIQHHAANGGALYYPDTEKPAFRDHVRAQLVQMARAGCTSLHQDDSTFMLVRRVNGCYANIPESQVRQKVINFYDWLRAEARDIFNRESTHLRLAENEYVPMTFNKTKFTGDPRNDKMNFLAPYFEGVMGEVDNVSNNPGCLYENIHDVNLNELRLSTITTLKDVGLAENYRHISTVYALGGHPIAPWDVFLSNSGARFWAEASDYVDYFKFVEEQAHLFDGFGIQDVLIDHNSNHNGIIRPKGLIRGVGNHPNSDQTNVAVVLKKNSQGDRVLHVTNWKDSRHGMPFGRHHFTLWIKKSAFDYVPTSITIHRPDKGSSTQNVIDLGDEIKITVNLLDIWGLVEFH